MSGLLEIVQEYNPDLPGINSSEAAEDWMLEAQRLERGVATPRSERILKSWRDVGLGYPRGGVGSFASYDAIINALTLGQAYPYDFFKIAPSASQGTAGLWQSLWTATGSPGAGSAPASTPGAAYSQAAGGITFPAPGSSQNKFMTTFGATANQTCVLALYDRLVGVGSVSLTSTGNKTVSSATLPTGRYDSSTTALNNEAWFEVTTASTTTIAVVTMNSYTTGDGTSGQTGTALTFPAAATVLTWAGKLPLLASKPGIQACSTVNPGTATTLGVVNFVIKRPLAYLPIISGQWNERDMVLQLTALPQILDNATLDFNILAPSGVTTTVWGNLRTVYG